MAGQTVAELVVQISAENADLKKKLDESAKATEKSFGKIGEAIVSAGAAIGIFSQLLKGIQFNAAAEQAETAFGVMLGSIDQAKTMLAELKDFANKTPLEFKDIRDATQTLVQFGVDGDKAVETVKMLGDVSGGNAERLKSLALAFGQIQSNGKLMGQDLLQLINAGFNPLKEISESTGESMASLKEKMEKGAISSDMVAESFKRATSEGGQFYGMLAQQADTLTGKQSTLNDAYETFLGALTKSLTGPIKAGMTVLTDLLNVFTNLPQPILAGAAALAGLGGAFAAALAAAKAFGIALPASLGPIGIAVAAITAGIVAIGTAIMANIEQNKNFEESLKGTSKLTLQQQNEVLENEKQALEASRKSHIERLAQFQKMGQTGSAAYKQVAKELDLLNERQGAISKRQQENNKKINEGIEAQKKSTEGLIDTNEDLSKKQLDAVKKKLDAEAKLREQEEKNAAEISRIKGEAALADALAEKKSLQEVEDGHTAWQARLKAARDKETAYAIKKADEEAAAVKAKQDEISAHWKKITEDIKSFASGIQGMFQAIGGEGAEIMATFASLAGNVIQVIASKGADTQAVFGAIQNAINLAFKGNEEGAEAFRKKLDEMGKVLLEDISPALGVVMASLEGMLPILKLVGEGLKMVKPYFQVLEDISLGVNNALGMVADLISGDNKSLAARWKVFTDGVAATFNGDFGKGLRLILGILTGGASELVASAFTGGQNTPQHASGTDFAPGGWSVVGEQGPELVKLPRGSQVKTNYESGDMMRSGSAGGNVTFVFNSPTELNPSEMMARARDSARRLAFEGAFA